MIPPWPYFKRKHLHGALRSSKKQDEPMARQNVFIPALLLLGATLAGAEEYEPRVGEPFPHLILPCLEDGSPLSMTSFRGKKLVLHIWASW